ncbi:MAG: hypothetical protein ABEJ93_04580 [Candidatus Nanohalobium sp.]
MGLIKTSTQLMIATVLVAGAAIPVVQASFTTDIQTVSGETEASTGSVPELVVADTVEYGLVDGSETLKVEDSFDNTNYTLDSDDYNVVSYEEGKFNVTNADVDSDGTNEINATSDTYYLSYDYKPNGYVGGLSAVILPFVVVGLAAGLLLMSFKPLMKKF